MATGTGYTVDLLVSVQGCADVRRSLRRTASPVRSVQYATTQVAICPIIMTNPQETHSREGSAPIGRTAAVLREKPRRTASRVLRVDAASEKFLTNIDDRIGAGTRRNLPAVNISIVDVRFAE